TDEAFSTRTVLQNTPNEKSSPFDTVDKKVVKSKKMNPIERLRQEIVEEEQKDKLISGNHLHEARENTKKDEKLVAKEEITKKDIKHTSFDQPEIPATIQAVTPLPFLYQSVLPSSPDASVKVSAHSKVKLSDVKVKPGLIAEDGAVRTFEGELRLDNNRLRLISESLPDGALSPLCKLRTLNLDYNLLASVPLGLPPSIKELYLRGNHIRQFCRGVFNGLSDGLVRVQLEHNLINMGKLDSQAFRCLRGFQVVSFY
uniref:Wu:fc23c09 n=1 Tax=Kryptolebias marmoratus TaxID=37003 RepID=A0A3Q3A809_KRYMA